MAKRTKRNHSLFIMFTVAGKAGVYSQMCIARMCEQFITAKDVQKVLTKVANYYGARMKDVLAIDGVTDDPDRYTADELLWANNRYYQDQDAKLFPRYVEAFNTRDETFQTAFNLWDWDYEKGELVLIRPAKEIGLTGKKI